MKAICATSRSPCLSPVLPEDRWRGVTPEPSGPRLAGWPRRLQRACGLILATWLAWALPASGGLTGHAGAAASPCVAIPPGLIAWWPGEGDARDLGPHGLTGSLLPGTAYGPGVVGAAFQGLPAGTGVRVTNAPWLRPTNLTVAAWVMSTGPSGYAYLVAKSYSGTRASYALYATAGRQLAFYVETTGPTGWARSGVAPATV